MTFSAKRMPAAHASSILLDIAAINASGDRFCPRLPKGGPLHLPSLAFREGMFGDVIVILCTMHASGTLFLPYLEHIGREASVELETLQKQALSTQIWQITQIYKHTDKDSK